MTSTVDNPVESLCSGALPSFDLPTEALIYGGGGYGRWVYETLIRSGVRVRGVIDQDPRKVHWINALSPEDSANLFPGIQVISGVFSPEPNPHSIDERLNGLGLSSMVTPAQFFWMLNSAGVEAERYWLTTDRNLYMKNSSEIARTFDLLKDAESKRTFLGLLRYRLGSPVEACPRPRPISEQHTGGELPFLDFARDGVILDCGAFTGDTLPNWESQTGVTNEIFCLEPDPDSFLRLLETSRSTSLRVIPLPFGVSEVSARYSVSGSGASARLLLDQNGPVSALRIDDLMVKRRTSMIKMDIEGLEAGALRGAKQVLLRDRPHLAISVYHKPWHLWSIANWLSTSIGGYELFMRIYGNQGYDTVLYAVPK